MADPETTPSATPVDRLIFVLSADSGRLAALATDLPCVIADAGGELVPLLAREVLERCNGKVADLRGRLVYYAGMKGLSLGST